ncbi:C6 transcription factor [Apiospora aurea]|uniref:C6 transcription factor n=1 Tax=Apiospora aurea TaxID=335848 RepID=A0ABR1PVF2_9PEZI
MVTTRSGAAAATPQRSTSSSSTTMAPTSNAAANNPAAAGVRWLHAPDRTTLFWFAVSLPLVIWDSIYVLGRPHTMEGGWLHWPLWAPYKLYGEVDHVYGWKSYNARNGFTAAQGALNVVETAMYLAYLWLWLTRAREVNVAARGGATKVLSGRPAATAVLLAFTAAVMTVSKTVLYWLNEYYSGFDNIGHNSIQDLIPLWIIPNGAWLIFPSYMIYVMGNEIIEGLTAASSGGAAIKSE